MGLTEKKNLPWNLQANTILERIHQVLQDWIATFELDNVDIPEEADKSSDPFAEYYRMRHMQYDSFFMLHTGSHQVN